METYGTKMASLRAYAGAARPRAAANLASTGNGCASAAAWQIKVATTPVFHTDRPARRLWELSP
jgi:hypothetical protein